MIVSWTEHISKEVALEMLREKRNLMCSKEQTEEDTSYDTTTY